MTEIGWIFIFTIVFCFALGSFISGYVFYWRGFNKNKPNTKLLKENAELKTELNYYKMLHKKAIENIDLMIETYKEGES